MSFGFSVGDKIGRPAFIRESSFAETRGCSSGVLRAITYQTRPTTNPSIAQTRKELRHPKCNMMYVTRGGVNPAPTPTPEKINPFARPRWELGIQRATN